MPVERKLSCLGGFIEAVAIEMSEESVAELTHLCTHHDTRSAVLVGVRSSRC